MINKKQSGFTLIEILLIVTIFIIILSSAVSLGTEEIIENDLIAKSLEVSDLVEKARNNSAVGFRNDVWSIKVLDSDALCDSSGDCVLLFKGRSFSSRNTGFDRFVQFDQNVTGVSIAVDQANEFYFNYKSGWLATSTASTLEQQNIVLDDKLGEQRSIVVEPSGVVSVFTCGEDKLTDVEGNQYNTIKIGAQCWMAENLNTGTMLATGATLPTDNSLIEKWCYDDTTANCTNEGALYDWDELMAYTTTEGGQGICPGGWHLPSDAELTTLEANYTPTTDAYNLRIGGPTGFHLPLSGELDPAVDASYYDTRGTLAVLWTSKENFAGNSQIRYIDDSSNPNVLDTAGNPQNWGFGARCLKNY
jgi:uncharacterized protein (TIGR02145 family)